MAQELRKSVWIFIEFMMLASLTFSAVALDFETLFMPGDVISGHAEFETECSNCHYRFKKGSQDKLCLDCHKETAQDFNTKKGFHGRSKTVQRSDCKTCHTEHAGRDADIIQLNQTSFNHTITDFKLEGAHRGVSCKSCHTAGNKYAEAPSACFDCHENDEPHKGNLGKQCDDCHKTESWQDFQYDHDKTDFPLQGKHDKVSCHSCHVNEQYKDIPQDCNSCHSLNDVHNGNNGNKCEDCHSPNNWDESEFDHQRDTDFSLNGRHKKVSCNACHIDPVADRKPPADCYSCHKHDDQHQGRNGRKCQSCHNEKSWHKSRFNHDTKTDFPLRGKHKKLTCTSCHHGDVYKEELSTRCIDCHRSDDVHKGQEGDNCSRCHQESGWSDKVMFDHDLTSFPLIGLHASTPCEECHLSSEFRNTVIECYACHARDDEHRKTLGTKCENCHNPNAWGLWEFDHNLQTDFKLDGAHEELGCNQCHIKPVSSDIKQSSSCHACHEQDDEHRGRFGRSCERCHNTETFSDVSIIR